MRRLRMFPLVVLLGLAACDSTPVEAVPEPETVETCDGLVEVGAQLTRAYVRVLEELRTDALLADDLPPEFVELQRLGNDLNTRVTGLGCDPAMLNTQIVEAVGQIETTTPAASRVLDIVRGGLVSTTTSLPPGAENPGTVPTSTPDDTDPATDQTTTTIP